MSCRAVAQGTIARFEKIYRRLHAPIENIEQLTEMEEYMASIPNRRAHSLLASASHPPRLHHASYC